MSSRDWLADVDRADVLGQQRMTRRGEPGEQRRHERDAERAAELPR